jgi:hypothetical protein
MAISNEMPDTEVGWKKFVLGEEIVTVFCLIHRLVFCPLNSFGNSTSEAINSNIWLVKITGEVHRSLTFSKA